jgi:hypothetical protein
MPQVKGTAPTTTNRAATATTDSTGGGGEPQSRAVAQGAEFRSYSEFALTAPGIQKSPNASKATPIATRTRELCTRLTIR